MTHLKPDNFALRFRNAVRLMDINEKMITYLIQQLRQSAHNMHKLRKCLFVDRHHLVFEGLDKHFVNLRLDRTLTLLRTYHEQLNTIGVTCSSHDRDVEHIELGYYISDSDHDSVGDTFEQSSKSAFEEALNCSDYHSESDGVVQASNSEEII